MDDRHRHAVREDVGWYDTAKISGGGFPLRGYGEDVLGYRGGRGRADHPAPPPPPSTLPTLGANPLDCGETKRAGNLEVWPEAAKGAVLSRRQHGFESRRGHQPSQHVCVSPRRRLRNRAVPLRGAGAVRFHCTSKAAPGRPPSTPGPIARPVGSPWEARWSDRPCPKGTRCRCRWRYRSRCWRA